MDKSPLQERFESTAPNKTGCHYVLRSGAVRFLYEVAEMTHCGGWVIPCGEFSPNIIPNWFSAMFDNSHEISDAGAHVPVDTRMRLRRS